MARLEMCHSFAGTYEERVFRSPDKIEKSYGKEAKPFHQARPDSKRRQSAVCRSDLFLFFQSRFSAGQRFRRPAFSNRATERRKLFQGRLQILLSVSNT